MKLKLISKLVWDALYIHKQFFVERKPYVEEETE